MNATPLLSTDNTRLKDLILRRAHQRISTQLESETVILDLETGTYSGLNQIGTSIWDLLAEPSTFAELLQNLMDEYEVSEEQCMADILTFLRELTENSLIEIIDRDTQ